VAVPIRDVMRKGGQEISCRVSCLDDSLRPRILRLERDQVSDQFVEADVARLAASGVIPPSVSEGARC
jgi:hypothetical protein